MIDYGLLYHQPEEKLMVHYAVTPENEQEVVSMLTDPLKNEPFRSLFDAHYVIRVVRSRNQMLEKLAIFDANFDDTQDGLYPDGTGIRIHIRENEHRSGDCRCSRTGN